jgi:hypothetical protein
MEVLMQVLRSWLAFLVEHNSPINHNTAVVVILNLMVGLQHLDLQGGAELEQRFMAGNEREHIFLLQLLKYPAALLLSQLTRVLLGYKGDQRIWK